MSTNGSESLLAIDIILLYFHESSKLTSETNLFVNEISRFAGLFLNPNASSLLGSYLTTREWQFLPHSYGK